MYDCQGYASVYGMGDILLWLYVESIDVGQCRMIKGTIKKIGMINDTMLCDERIGQISLILDVIRA